MKRRLITILIVLLSLSIAGIIGLQLIWITNAFRVKEDLFRRDAMDALNHTVKRLELMHDVTIINRMAFPDSLSVLRHQLRVPSPPGIRLELPNKRLQFRTIRNFREMRIKSDTASGNVTEIRMTTLPEENTLAKDSIKSTSRREVVFFRSEDPQSIDSILHKDLLRLDSLTSFFDTLARTQPAIPRVDIRAEGLRRLTERAVTEMVTLDKPRVDPELLENILTEELNKRQIPLTFHYGVFRDSAMIASSDQGKKEQLLGSPIKTELYPNSIFRRNIQLSLWFPERGRFVIRSMGWLSAASLLFATIMLVTFSLSVIFLLRQKRLADIKSDFINNMTHEFKTPIATIAVAADSLMNDKVTGDPDLVKYFSGMIRKENKRMDKQVEDILTIARMEKKELDFHWERFNLHELLSDIIASIELQVQQRDGQIIAVLEATQPEVLSDRKHLSHAIFNLIDNANKYTEEKPRIIVHTINYDGGIQLSVTDNGTGMSKQVQARIFERFYRQTGGNIHNVKGFGLGLSYTKAVVEAGKGIIRVESEPGKGSRFELFLPG